MDLTRIFTIGGKPGLQQLIAQSKNGVIVESLVDKKRFNASSSSKISSLEDISVFCVNEDKPLKEVLLAIGTKNNFSSIEVPAEDDLKSTLESYVSNLDNDRVYTSDVKKIFKWYNLLITAGLLKEEKVADKKAEDTDSEKKKSTASKTTASKTTAKKPAAKKSVAQASANKKKVSAKAAPAKKTASTAKKGA